MIRLQLETMKGREQKQRTENDERRFKNKQGGEIKGRGAGIKGKNVRMKKGDALESER